MHAMSQSAAREGGPAPGGGLHQHHAVSSDAAGCSPESQAPPFLPQKLSLEFRIPTACCSLDHGGAGLQQGEAHKSRLAISDPTTNEEQQIW